MIVLLSLLASFTLIDIINFPLIFCNDIEVSGCTDSANGATDDGGDGCFWYIEREELCGLYDDEDFTADVMCCVCKASDGNEGSGNERSG